MKNKLFTVVGLCGEQRHAFHVQARSAARAERKCRREHDGETSYRLVVAGVAPGRIVMVDGDDAGLDAQIRDAA